MLAPIALFTYNRPDHTRRTVESLLRNRLAGESDVIVYSDAARTPDKRSTVDEVRAYLATIVGFRSIVIRHREENYGLARSIIQGVTEVLQQAERVIVLEDDLVTSPHFLTYMNEALDKFADDDRVASIHGYVYPVGPSLPEAFFLPGADCWGWATWRRAWACFNPDGQHLLDELRRRKLVREFDFNGAYPFSEMLKNQIRGKNDSWAVRWHASAFLAGKLTLYPGRSLVRNIGNDDSGTHCGNSSQWDAALSDRPIDLSNVPVEASLAGRKSFEAFLRRGRSVHRRLLHRVVPAKGMGAVKVAARDWLPPALIRWMRMVIPAVGNNRYEGDYRTWSLARAHCTGYDAGNILAKVLEATLKVQRGEAAYERDSVVFDEIEYSWPLLAGLMWAASRAGGRLNVLDIGGALGSSYFQNRKFLQTLPDIRWNVVEQAHYVEAGRANIQEERLRFYETIDECRKENQPDVILLSSVLQYLEAPHELIGRLSDIGAKCLIIDRTPFSDHGGNRIVIQRVPPSIYPASYPMWVFSRRDFMTNIDAGWQLMAEVMSPEGRVQSGTGIDFSFQGMILAARP